MRHLIAVLFIFATTLLATPAAAAPDLTVRMGQLVVGNNVPTAATAGTYHDNIIPGEERTIRLLLENRGDANLTISSAQFEGPGASQYIIFFGPDNLIEPGEGSFLLISYLPAAPGSHIAALRIDSNDPDDAPYFVNFQGQCSAEHTAPLPVDIGIAAVRLTAKCNLKKNLCTVKGKADVFNLATAPSVGFTWLLTPSDDGLFNPNTMFLWSGFTKKIKAYKGFPATLPKKKAKLKGVHAIPSPNRFVLFVIPNEGDLDWSDNSIEVMLPVL